MNHTTLKSKSGDVFATFASTYMVQAGKVVQTASGKFRILAVDRGPVDRTIAQPKNYQFYVAVTERVPVAP